MIGGCIEEGYRELGCGVFLRVPRKEERKSIDGRRGKWTGWLHGWAHRASRNQVSRQNLCYRFTPSARLSSARRTSCRRSLT